MQRVFSKYSANGNDFIIFDDRDNSLEGISSKTWSNLCHRNWGIGADGVLLFKNSSLDDCLYQMRYLNSDGHEVGMCGNGARALADYAKSLNQFDQLADSCSKSDFYFQTKNAKYRAIIQAGKVELLMSEFSDYARFDLADFADELNALNYGFADTGVPHCMFELEDIERPQLMEIARKVRFDKRFPEGTNINFYQLSDGLSNTFKIRTFERGVDAETLACGTGVVAVARHLHHEGPKHSLWTFSSPGGELRVELRAGNFFFSGDIRRCFDGSVDFSQY